MELQTPEESSKIKKQLSRTKSNSSADNKLTDGSDILPSNIPAE